MMMEESALESDIILFDGVCNLCNASVQWIIRHDKKDRFRFASLQSETGKYWTEKYNLSEDIKSVVLISNGRAFTKSSAALRIAGKCSGLWKLWYAGLIVPPFIRDGIYQWIARNRYKWFGKNESCWLPDKSLIKKFI